MVKDLVLDIKEHDLTLENTSANVKFYDVIWGDLLDTDKNYEVLFCNVIIPYGDWSIIQFDEKGEFVCNFRTHYTPINQSFRIRFVKFANGSYQVFDTINDEKGSKAYSYHLDKSLANPINACQLPIVDIDGDFKTRLVKNPRNEMLSRAYIYSAKSTDISIGYSDDQAAQLLSLCTTGSHYRYPTAGVGLSAYINTVIEHTDLHKVMNQQFIADQKTLNDIVFNSNNGDLSLDFSPEPEIKDNDLISPDYLDMSIFASMTDSEARKAIILDEKSGSEYLLSLSESLTRYEGYTEILFFPNTETNIVRIVGDIQSGLINLNGEFETDESSDYYVISANLDSGSLVMFDVDEGDNNSNFPDLVVNDIVTDELYQSLVGQPRWVGDKCHKCFMLKKAGSIKHMIRKDSYRNGKGIFIIPPTSENIKNIISIIQDINTGRYLCMVSKNTNISDLMIEEITSHIYTLMN